MQVEGDSCRVQDFLTPYQNGDVSFSVLAAPKALEEAYNIHHNYAVRAIRKLQTQYDYILIDMASMFSTLNLAMLDLSTIVTFLGIVDFIPTIKNMKIGMDTLKMLGYDKNKIRLVLNAAMPRPASACPTCRNSSASLLPRPAQRLPRRQPVPARGNPPRTRQRSHRPRRRTQSLVARYTNHTTAPAETAKAQEESSWLSRIFS